MLDMRTWMIFLFLYLFQRRGQFKQQCSEPDNHIQALVEYIISGVPTESGRVNRLKMVFLNEVLG